MEYSLYLDDERTPSDDDWHIGEWVVIRDSRQAILYIRDNGPPSYMSLDWYLGWTREDGMKFLDRLFMLDRRMGHKIFNTLEDINMHSSDEEKALAMRVKVSEYLTKNNLTL